MSCTPIHPSGLDQTFETAFRKEAFTPRFCNSQAGTEIAAIIGITGSSQ